MVVGLGCMRLDDDAVIAAAIDQGVTWLDTAHAYEGSEERIARVLATRPGADVRIVTKVGMTRPAGAWVPDGRAGTILAQAKESRARLGRVPDILMLHAPDPAVPLATSLRALEKARDQGLAHAIGLSNPSRRDLDELAAAASPSSAPEAAASPLGVLGAAASRAGVPIAAIEVALGPKHDAAARAGMLAWCKERGILVFAHSPLGGVAHAPRLARDTALTAIAKRHGATAAEVMLAYLCALGPHVIPIPGARRLETARATVVLLDAADLAVLDERFPGLGRVPLRPPAEPSAEVVLVMGIAGAGKSTLMTRFPADGGWERLNRDALGGTLAGIAKRLEAALAGGAKRVVLDNTYLSRATRADVVRVAHRAGASVRCVHLEIALADARINVVSRMLERYGTLLGGAELKKHRDPQLLLPTPLANMLKQLEAPSLDEGFSAVETIPFVRAHASGRAGAAVPIDNLGALDAIPADVPVLVFGWNVDPDAARERVELRGAERARPIEVAICTHGDGPPTCWCRPPLPGLWLVFARKYGIDPRLSTMHATAAAHRTMANELGLKVV